MRGANISTSTTFATARRGSRPRPLAPSASQSGGRVHSSCWKEFHLTENKGEIQIEGFFKMVIYSRQAKFSFKYNLAQSTI